MFSHTNTQAGSWLKLIFTNDAVITHVVVYYLHWSPTYWKYTANNKVCIFDAEHKVWEHTIETKEKPFYVIHVPTIKGKYLKNAEGETNLFLCQKF